MSLLKRQKMLLLSSIWEKSCRYCLWRLQFTPRTCCSLW